MKLLSEGASEAGSKNNANENLKIHRQEAANLKFVIVIAMIIIDKYSEARYILFYLNDSPL